MSLLDQILHFIVTFKLVQIKEALESDKPTTELCVALDSHIGDEISHDELYELAEDYMNALVRIIPGGRK